VQGVLEDALSRILRTDAHVTVAGRTDAGVHAVGQVCHLDVADDVHPDELVHRLNRALPADIRILDGGSVSTDFDARFAALWRRYRYRVSDSPVGPPPLSRHDTAHHPRPVSLRALRAAAGPLRGLHDFGAFCRAREGGTTVRTLRRLSWVRGADGVLVATVEADAFCHSMVRALVGALLLVGDGRRAPDWPASLLGAGPRAPDVPLAPAHGLTLVAVGYPSVARYARRTAETRRRRDA
jgi:tRNA pseudouridine38-40 synthase